MARRERNVAVVLLLIAGMGYALWPPRLQVWWLWILTWMGVLAASLIVLWRWGKSEPHPVRQGAPTPDRTQQEWAHEIRTPLMHVQLYVQQLRRAVPEGQMGALDGLEAELTRISQMMESMSVLSQGSSRAETDVLDFQAWLQQSLPLYREAADTLGFELLIELETVSPIRADIRALRQVLSNAFSNAFRYGDPGTAVTVRLLPDGPLWVALTIANASPLPNAPLRDLTQPFVRGHEHGSGTGLGLSVVSRLMDGMGGRVMCRYVDGQFQLRLLFPRWMARPPVG